MQHYPQIREHIPKSESTKYVLETSFTLDPYFSTTQVNRVSTRVFFLHRFLRTDAAHLHIQ